MSQHYYFPTRRTAKLIVPNRKLVRVSRDMMFLTLTLKTQITSSVCQQTRDCLNQICVRNHCHITLDGLGEPHVLSTTCFLVMAMMKDTFMIYPVTWQ